LALFCNGGTSQIWFQYYDGQFAINSAQKMLLQLPLIRIEWYIDAWHLALFLNVGNFVFWFWNCENVIGRFAINFVLRMHLKLPWFFDLFWVTFFSFVWVELNITIRYALGFINLLKSKRGLFWIFFFWWQHATPQQT
jgi:hypothetical protein